MSRKTPRIEPTLFGDGESQEPIITEEYFRTDASNKELMDSLKSTVIGYYNRANQFVRNPASRKSILIGGGLLIAICLAVVLGLDTPSEEEPPVEKPQPVKTISRFHQVGFPDKFWLWSTEHHGMVINWKAEESTESKIWDIASAEGDQTCENITFNNGESYRSLAVLIEQGSHYFASFSPLDSAAIVNNIAMRGSFELCGYEFSLKGSQSILSQHSHYGEFLTP